MAQSFRRTLVAGFLLVLICISCRKDKTQEQEQEKGIAFLARTGNGGIHLWAIGADKKNLTQVFPEETGDFSSNPAWSSDGKTIFFLRNTLAAGENGIYSVRPNGTELRKVLTDDAAQKRNFFQLAASYDAEHICFSLEIPRTGRKVIELYRMCPCGDRVERLTNFETALSTTLSNTEAYAGSFSSDSKYLYLAKSDPTITGIKDVYIYRMDMATKENQLVKTIRARNAVAAAPSVSPDNKQLLLAVDENIFVMNTDGSAYRQIGNLRGYHPVWKNNIDFYFSSNNYENFQPGIFLSNIRFTKVEPLITTPGDYTYGGLAINNTYTR